MASYRIVCTNQEPPDEPHDEAHIAVVGTGDDPDSADKKWQVGDVRDALDDGTTFYTKSETTGETAEVEKYDCSCGYKTIRTKPDERIDNNLDDLRKCNWS